jgi:glucose-1-phosphate cytidylyltransferase
MKAVILAGGLGTRLSEETSIRPKPMVEIGGLPILWHILKIYSSHGINDFIICCGYKGYVIKEYFANYFLHTSDVTFDMSANVMTVHNSVAEPWRVTLVDTGEKTGTGGRLKKIAKYVQDDEAFCMTYDQHSTYCAFRRPRSQRQQGIFFSGEAERRGWLD